MTWTMEDVKWHAVASWTWDAGDDMCSICRTPFDGCPPDGKYPGDDSPVVWGVCGHAFHLQCISKWLQSQEQSEQRCPFCRRGWEFKAAAVESTEAAPPVHVMGGEQPVVQQQQQQQEAQPGAFGGFARADQNMAA